jgi:tyrosine phenol-lyase
VSWYKNTIRPKRVDFLLEEYMNIEFKTLEKVPVDMFKPVIVQKIHMRPVTERLEAIRKAGFNTFLLNTNDIFMDMLTDSGTNAMSNMQLSAMMQADEAYAGSQSFVRLEASVHEFFGMEFFLPVHQGRAAEHIIAETFVGKGQIVPMNFHFTTTRAHIERVGGRVEELIIDEAYKISSTHPFKGNMDIKKLEASIKKHGADNIAFIRMEVATNLTGGQPVSVKNLHDVRKVADRHGLMLIVDACLIAENAWLVKQREPGMADKTIATIIREICDVADIVYFSARKLGAVRGGGIVTKRKDLFEKMKDLVPLFEGFFTYGGMSTREIEALAVGLKEFTDESVICHMPESIAFAVRKLKEHGIPVVTPAGVLGLHIDAKAFLPNVPQRNYTAGALAAALFIVSGIRTMERGTISTDRDPDTGEERLSDLELIRAAFPRRVFSLSQIEFLVDRIIWLHKNRKLIGGLTFVDEPKVLRFFSGKLKPIGGWDEKLVKAFKKDFANAL